MGAVGKHTVGEGHVLRAAHGIGRGQGRHSIAPERDW